MNAQIMRSEALSEISKRDRRIAELEAEVARLKGTAPALPCMVCAKLPAAHGSYPTCATHPYSADGRCGHAGVLVAGAFVGHACPGPACVNGCTLAVPVGVSVAPGQTFSQAHVDGGGDAG
jgi:hypothetical protein